MAISFGFAAVIARESGRSSTPMRFVQDANLVATGCPAFAGHDGMHSRKL
jgi:hypothetical protein